MSHLQKLAEQRRRTWKLQRCWFEPQIISGSMSARLVTIFFLLVKSYFLKKTFDNGFDCAASRFGPSKVPKQMQLFQINLAWVVLVFGPIQTLFRATPTPLCHRITWDGRDLRCGTSLIDTHSSDVRYSTQKQWNLWKLAISWRYKKVQDHFVHIGKRTFGACCQAACINAPFAVSVAFPLQTNRSRVHMESS